MLKIQCYISCYINYFVYFKSCTDVISFVNNGLISYIRFFLTENALKIEKRWSAHTFRHIYLVLKKSQHLGRNSPTKYRFSNAL